MHRAEILGTAVTLGWYQQQEHSPVAPDIPYFPFCNCQLHRGALSSTLGASASNYFEHQLLRPARAIHRQYTEQRLEGQPLPGYHILYLGRRRYITARAFALPQSSEAR